ncbi:MAG: FAD-dependent oxidoreductase [Actinomycetaceae bacterium]|nr:FAD-dependent oxidoreductase [Actinomycetaceae bacterium]
MAQIVILGAGIAGHTAAMVLQKKLKRTEHKVVVISPKPTWNWVPSNIWVGTGRMKREKVVFELAPLYKKLGIEFHQAAATALYPEGDATNPRSQVELVYTDEARNGETARVEFDYLINATGPKLNFAATPGLGPDEGYTQSVCTDAHAEECSAEFLDAVKRMKAGEHLRFVIGTGAGTCTCQGAAFEFTFNTEHELREHGVRDKAEIVYLTNEPQLGDLGVGGMKFKQDGYMTTSQLWTESIFRERGVKAIVGAAVKNIEKTSLTYEDSAGEMHDLDYDFAMLLPPFTGVPMKAYNRDGEDISATVFNPAGFMKVDADYTPKPYEEWRAADWPKTYQNPTYKNMFAVGIAFAPPHAISKPHTTKNGTLIAPAPPRTGQPSGVMAAKVAESIVDLLKNPNAKLHEASMGNLGAVCDASTGANMRTGSAAAIMMFPIVPDETVYPETGRHATLTRGELGLFGHWVKVMLHHLFIYKAKGKPGWNLIPE